MDGELGEGRAATNLTTAILGSRRGGKHRGGAPGLFRSCGSVRGLVTRRRSSGAARGIVGTAVVAATANGGGGRVRWSVRERDRGGERGRGRERGGPGSRGGAGEKTRGVAVARRHRQAAWWRGARARAGVLLSACLARGSRWLARASTVLGRPVGCQVRSGRLCSFYLFLFCFVLFYLIATEFKFKQI